jgi:hypothetical protein
MNADFQDERAHAAEGGILKSELMISQEATESIIIH